MSDLALPKLEDRLRAAQKKFNIFGDTGLPKPAVVESSNEGALSSLCIGVKDNIAVEGYARKAGMGHRHNEQCDEHAHVVRQMLEHGASLVPGLNMDEAALGGVTENPHFGRTDNPSAQGYSTGGSSGGSAAAVASGVVDLALGTDTLGSIRNPASWCGIVGLKPTHGLIGMSGIVPLAPSLDTVGPMAATASHLKSVFDILVAPDPDDPNTLSAPDDLQGRALPKTIRIGVPSNIEAVDCEEATLSALALARSTLKDCGFQIVPVTVPHWSPSALRKASFLYLEAEAALALAKDLQKKEAFSESTRKMLEYGRSVPAPKLAAAVGEMRRASAGFQHAFHTVDFLLTPTTPQRAIPAFTSAPPNLADFTAPANAAGFPAIAVPVSLRANERPASVQLMGPKWSDWHLIDCAVALEAQLARRV
ncbi:amidase [Pseudahrensia aquimaris]|uniref:Amidase n=1 Tax=Pseudahrensia aquimaris TaxID=744461 RepID=A0ABW3FHH4_9HYPH